MAHMRMFRIRNTFIIVIMAHLLSIENQGIHLQRVKADRWLYIGFRET